MLSRTSAYSGQIRVTAVVENMGGAAWVSRHGQQAVHLTDGRTIRAASDFTQLNPGQRVTVSWDQAWNASTYAEFPPSFEARLAYDPDIYIDGNRQNDDCKRVDNRRTLDGHTINAMVRG